MYQIELAEPLASHTNLPQLAVGAGSIGRNHRYAEVVRSSSRHIDAQVVGIRVFIDFFGSKGWVLILLRLEHGDLLIAWLLTFDAEITH